MPGPPPSSSFFTRSAVSSAVFGSQSFCGGKICNNPKLPGFKDQNTQAPLPPKTVFSSNRSFISESEALGVYNNSPFSACKCV
jgi:hypothetical protein